MVFASTIFLFIFLPALWLIYMLIPQKKVRAQNVVLGIFSLLFYAYGEPVYIVIMLLSVLVNYLAARGIEGAIRRDRGKLKKTLAVLTVVFNLALLGFFKYVPWLCGLVNGATGWSIPIPGFSLPVGISFYTFQVLSYVLDVNKGKSAAQKNYFDLLLYISFFPQLIAGPIVAYEDIREQLHHREMTWEKTAHGIRRFLFGLAKKVLISNTAALIADAAFGAAAPSSALAWLGAVCYSIQIYFDFSGYSDMAIGLASMFGFSIMENFNYPYSAVTIRDFWKRWHISLTSWFREYVYFPLGGNRVSKGRTVFNRCAVFFLTGIWHGANFTYLLWGMWHGALQMLEEVLHFDKLAKKKPLRPFLRLYTLLAVCLGFVMFRAESVGAGFAYFGRMFSFSGGLHDALQYLNPYTLAVLLCGVVLSAPVFRSLQSFFEKKGWHNAFGVACYVISVPLFALSVMTLASSSFNPFIYYIF